MKAFKYINMNYIYKKNWEFDILSMEYQCKLNKLTFDEFNQ